MSARVFSLFCHSLRPKYKFTVPNVPWSVWVDVSCASQSLKAIITVYDSMSICTESTWNIRLFRDPLLHFLHEKNADMGFDITAINGGWMLHSNHMWPLAAVCLFYKRPLKSNLTFRPSCALGIAFQVRFLQMRKVLHSEWARSSLSIAGTAIAL